MNKGRVSGWKTPAGRAEYVAAYDATMELWPVPFESLLVPTRYGLSHVIVSGPSGGEPLVLLHAATGFGATQWYPNAGALASSRRIYSVDSIGSAGKGIQTRPILMRSDFADWLGDVLDGLDLARTDLLASSQGGWLALNLALLAPERVGALALLAPAASILPIRPVMRMFIRVGPSMPAWTGPPSLKAMFGGRVEVDDRVVRQLTLHLRHFRYQERAVHPTAFPGFELGGLLAPTLLLVGEHEVIYDPAAVFARARKLIRNIETGLVEGVGHLINMERPQIVEERVLPFLSRSAGLARL